MSDHQDPVGNPTVPSVQDLLSALDEVTAAHQADQGRRDQIITALRRVHRLSLRRIAEHTDVDHTSVERIAARVALQPVILRPRPVILTPEVPNWVTVTAEAVMDHLVSTYNPGSNIVPDREWEVLLQQSNVRASTATDHPPDWFWLASSIFKFAQMAQDARGLLYPIDGLQAARNIMLSATGRVQLRGEDLERPFRGRWMAAIAGIVVELNRKKGDDWRLEMVDRPGNDQEDPDGAL